MKVRLSQKIFQARILAGNLVLQCALIHTHEHSHTHTHMHAYMCTHTPWAVSHSCININALLLQFILFPNCRPTNIKLFLAVILFITCFSFVFLLEPYLFLNCLVYQCAHLCMHTHTSTTCNCSHMFIVCVNLCFLALAITNRSSCCLLYF